MGRERCDLSPMMGNGAIAKLWGVGNQLLEAQHVVHTHGCNEASQHKGISPILDSSMKDEFNLL